MAREVWLRAAPRRDSAILDGLPEGEALRALPGAPPGWTRVARNGRPAGYVSSGYLTDRRPAPSATPKPRADSADGVTGLCQIPDGLPPPPLRIAPPGTVARALTDAYIRAAPSCGAPILDVLEKGHTVTVVSGGNDGWYRIRGRNGQRGYIGARLLAEAQRPR